MWYGVFLLCRPYQNKKEIDVEICPRIGNFGPRANYLSGYQVRNYEFKRYSKVRQNIFAENRSQ